jgi:hypothetical protein
VGPPEYPERRHRHAGRRESDPRNVTAGAIIEAAVEDRLFPSWTKKDVAQWLGILIAAGTIYVGLSTWFATRFATRKEIEEQVQPVAHKLDAFAGSTNTRLQRIEERQHNAEAVHELLVPMARLQCLDYQRQRSLSLADAAGLPCDSLLRRVTPR